MTGGDTHYATIRIPKWISDKYGFNDKTVIEFVEMESEGGVLIKKST
jgi:bifunctional DNA-binding transcriptional regulator/antitoxin component of YhaV-PrlF toxin-antitoxin module